jgi:hypothetical protein
MTKQETMTHQIVPSHQIGPWFFGHQLGIVLEFCSILNISYPPCIILSRCNNPFVVFSAGFFICSIFVYIIIPISPKDQLKSYRNHTRTTTSSLPVLQWVHFLLLPKKQHHLHRRNLLLLAIWSMPHSATRMFPIG